MAWNPLSAWLALPCSLGLALACGNGQVQDSGDFDGGGTTTSSGGETTASTTSTAATDASGTGATTSAASTTTAATEATVTAADSTTGPGEPVVCTEELTCNPGEICVLPCCGGPKPGCFELPPGGECGPGGTPDEGGVRCCQDAVDPVACMKLQWCAPVPCVPDPPRCATSEEVTCNGTDCTTEGCYGDLIDGQLQCSCK